MTLVYLALAWLAGIAAASSVSVPWWGWLAAALLMLLVAILRAKGGLRVLAGCAALFALGGMRMALVEAASPPDIATFNGRGFVTVEGEIVDAPEIRDATVTLRVKVERIIVEDGEPIPTEGVVLVQAPNVATYRYGDSVTVRGEIVTPPDGDDFSYKDYLARQDIYSLIQYAQVEVPEGRRGNPVRAALLDFRAQAHRMIRRLLPDPHASLLAGILLGIETDISPEVREAFNAVGATHIIVISGSNLAILAGLLWGVSRRWLKDNGATAVTIAGIIVYAAFVGGDPAVTRAAIMTTLGLIATRLGRQTYGLASLSFAALLLTAIDPRTLWDVSFQLSFMATLGLVLYVEPLRGWVERGFAKLFSAERAQKIAGALSDAFTVTLGAQIATAPLIAYHFGRFSPVSLLVNLLIVPVQSNIMVLGGLGVLASMVVWPVGQVLVWGSWLFLSWTIGIVRFFARLPYASTAIQPSAGVVLVVYLLLFGVTWITMQPEKERAQWGAAVRRALSVKMAGTAGLLSVALLFSAAFALPDNRLHVTFIDVGEGAATLIETPSGRHVLIDAGGSGRRLSAALGDELPFWDRSLDLVVLTQPTRDHSGALITVLERYDVDAVLTNGRHGDSEISGALWAELNEQGVEEVIAAPGMRITVGDGVVLEVLHSDRGLDDDPASPGEPVVLMVSYGNLRVLLPGDLSEEAETVLMSTGQPIDATVLHVPRGGHRSSSSEGFLTAVSPEIGIIAPLSNDLPHAETVERLEAAGSVIYRLDQVGSVRLTSDGQQMWIAVDHE